MDNSLVGQLNQAAINGIRAAGATSQYIFVEGNSWTGAWTWVWPLCLSAMPSYSTGSCFNTDGFVQVSSGTSTDMGALTDSARTDGSLIVYEMHQYLDSDGSGTSTTCVNSTIGQNRVAAATQWLKENGKRGIIGETAGGANANCIQAVTGMLQYMEDNSDAWLGWLWWGGGPWVSTVHGQQVSLFHATPPVLVLLKVKDFHVLLLGALKIY